MRLLQNYSKLSFVAANFSLRKTKLRRLKHASTLIANVSKNNIASTSYEKDFIDLIGLCPSAGIIAKLHFTILDAVDRCSKEDLTPQNEEILKNGMISAAHLWKRKDHNRALQLLSCISSVNRKIFLSHWKIDDGLKWYPNDISDVLSGWVQVWMVPSGFSRGHGRLGVVKSNLIVRAADILGDFPQVDWIPPLIKTWNILRNYVFLNLRREPVEQNIQHLMAAKSVIFALGNCSELEKNIPGLFKKPDFQAVSKDKLEELVKRRESILRDLQRTAKLFNYFLGGSQTGGTFPYYHPYPNDSRKNLLPSEEMKKELVSKNLRKKEIEVYEKLENETISDLKRELKREFELLPEEEIDKLVSETSVGKRKIQRDGEMKNLESGIKAFEIEMQSQANFEVGWGKKYSFLMSL